MKSLVIPVYKNEAGLDELLDAVAALAAPIGVDFEVVFVVDGSPDRCAEILRERLPQAPFRSKLLIHSRNYGSFAAIRSGLRAAAGDALAVMAADLQEPPELIEEFFRILDSDEVDVVVGSREARDDPWRSRLASGVFWWLYKRLVNTQIPDGGVDVFGCNRRFRDELLRLHESHSSLVGLIYWLGFRRATVSYSRRPRQHGHSAWTLRGKLDYLMDSLFAFSDLPVKLLLGVGVAGLSVSVVFGLVIFLTSLLSSFDVPGYAATVTTVLFFGALNTMGIGIVGSYVWRAYANTQRRPLAVVMREYEFGATPAARRVEADPRR
jgi:glycosyltransferase involved in cell wall biosynthesis